MKQRLFRNHALRVFSERIAGVHVSVEAWEVAAGNVEPHPMPLPEDNRHGRQVDHIDLHLTGRNQTWAQQPVPKPGTQDSLSNVEGGAIRVNINQFSGKIRVRGGSGGG